MKLVCVPFAGGGASRFSPLARLLAPEVSLYAVQFPGRERRIGDPSFSDTGELVAELAEIVGSIIDGPYGVLGYSLGASYAFELIRTLVANGVPNPQSMVAVAAPAPHTRTGQRLGDAPDDVLLDRMRQWQAVAPEILAEPELLTMALDALRIDLRTWERSCHDSSAMISCPIIVYFGQEDPTVNRSQLLGWRSRTTAASQFRAFSGGHLFGFDQPETVAAALSVDLAPRG